MRYIVTGGGTGGHVTPIKHVVASLKELDKNAVVAFVGQKGDRFGDMISKDDAQQKKSIRAGKYRRYPRALWKTIIDIPTHLLNLRDAFYVGIGYLQSLLFLRKFKPDAIFVKGGYVSVPVGMAASTLGIPFVTHDSDLIPGLANKVVAPWAKYNTVASKAGDYPYAKDKIKFVGVPINPKFYQNVSDERQKQAKAKIGAGDNPVVFVLGGSLGAKSINDAVVSILNDLIENTIEVFHVAGTDNYAEVKNQVSSINSQNLYHLYDFISDQDLLLEHYIAADVVVSRAGATNTAEVAGLAKPAVIIPAQLADQLVNGKELEQTNAAVILHDADINEAPEKLFNAIDLILKDEELKRELTENIVTLAKKNASKQIAELLYEVANG